MILARRFAAAVTASLVVVAASVVFLFTVAASRADVKAELEGVLASELSARKFSYPRSDGSAWALTLKEASDRRRTSRWPTT
jgi:hypothetical protein